jgi:hypothetical protein
MHELLEARRAHRHVAELHEVVEGRAFVFVFVFVVVRRLGLTKPPPNLLRRRQRAHGPIDFLTSGSRTSTRGLRSRASSAVMSARSPSTQSAPRTYVG